MTKYFPHSFPIYLNSKNNISDVFSSYHYVLTDACNALVSTIPKKKVITLYTKCFDEKNWFVVFFHANLLLQVRQERNFLHGFFKRKRDLSWVFLYRKENVNHSTSTSEKINVCKNTHWLPP